MADYFTNVSAQVRSNSDSQESLQYLDEFSADDNRRISKRFRYSGCSALRNSLIPPLQTHPHAYLSSISNISPTSTSSTSAYSHSVTPRSGNDDHQLHHSMKHGNILYAARHRTTSPLNCLQSIDKVTEGGTTGAAAAVRAFGSLAADWDERSDTHLTKAGRAERSYHCRRCDQEFENKSEMQRHAKEIHRMDEKGHQCSKCLKSFPSSQQLAQHSLVHTNIRKYPCRFCDKAFKQLSHVQQHQRIHTGERPYRCPVDSCSKAFRQLSSLQQHIKGHNVPLPRSYMITPHFVSQATRAHRPTDKIHSGVARPHDLTCQVCEKQCLDEVRFFEHIHKFHPDYWRVFSSGRPLSDFIDVSRRETLFTCSICHSTYSQETVYWKHMLTHSCRPSTIEEASMEEGELRMYDCTICCKLFTKESYLMRHLEMKLDAEHSARLVELKRSGSNSPSPYSAAPLLEQIENEPLQTGNWRGGGARREEEEGDDDGGGDDERKPSRWHLKGHHGPSFSSAALAGIYQFNTSRTLDYQRDCNNRFTSLEHLGHSLFEPNSAVVKQEVGAGRFSAEEVTAFGGQASAVAGHRVSRSSLLGSPGSPLPLKPYLTGNQPRSRGLYRSFYSPPDYEDDRPRTPTTGLSLLNSSRTLFPNQPLTLTQSGLTRSPEPQGSALGEQNPYPLNYHRAELSPSFAQRFQPPGEGGSPPVFAMTTSPRLFTHYSAVSPPYDGLPQPKETSFRRPASHCPVDAFQSRGETINGAIDSDRLRSALRERALASNDLRQSETADDAKVQLKRSLSRFDHSHQPRVEPHRRDIRSYLRRTSLAETDVSMLLRRTDTPDHFMATTFNHLSRSITGLRGNY